MEKLKKIPFYKSLGFTVFLFNAILLVSIMAPSIILNKKNYKNLLDRNVYHRNISSYCINQISNIDSKKIPEFIESLPRFLNRQRICIFNLKKELIFDSGIMKVNNPWENIKPLFPHPYINWKKEEKNYDPQTYINHLLKIDESKINFDKSYISTRNVKYKQGMDRIIISGKLIHTKDNEMLVFTITNSIVDLLIYYRAIKERLLLIYISVILISIFLTLTLSWFVTSPLKKLYTYSRELMASNWKGKDTNSLPIRGEIGEICRTIQVLINNQKKQSENFKKFSSDIVNELKTPLSAIRSGLEVYTESKNPNEQNEVYNRINIRIQQMENLMNKIQDIGNIESSSKEEKCTNILKTCNESLYEFKKYNIQTNISENISNYSIYISCENLFQIIQNLLKNAVSFSPIKKSVELIISIKNRNLVITVRDEGPGIRPEVFDNIKNRFFSYRPEKIEKHSGLGLAIIDAILRNCNGKMYYKNLEPKGAEFIISIPANLNRN